MATFSTNFSRARLMRAAISLGSREAATSASASFTAHFRRTSSGTRGQKTFSKLAS